jgi:hypothetical protein
VYVWWVCGWVGVCEFVCLCVPNYKSHTEFCKFHDRKFSVRFLYVTILYGYVNWYQIATGTRCFLLVLKETWHERSCKVVQFSEPKEWKIWYIWRSGMHQNKITRKFTKYFMVLFYSSEQVHRAWEDLQLTPLFLWNLIWTTSFHIHPDHVIRPL